jgi:acyl-CoA thioesterase-1
MRPRTLLLAGILVLIAIAGILLALYKSTAPSSSCRTLSPQPRIVAFGDSLVAGYGAPPASSIPSVLSGLLGAPVENLGLVGETTEAGLARLEALRIDPDIAIVLLGGNDALRQVPVEETKANLGRIIDRFEERGARVVLVGVMGGFPEDAYEDMYAELAREKGVLLVPNILSGLFGDARYMSDAIHPNAEGYARAAARIAPSVATACKEHSRSRR